MKMDGDFSSVQHHCIDKITIDLNVADEASAYKHMNGVSTHLYDLLMHEIEKIANEVIPPDVYISLDQIEIDLGKLDVNNNYDPLSGEWKDKFRRLLQEAITHQENWIPELEEDEIIKKAVKKSSSQLVAKQLQLFLTFVQTGQTPSWVKALIQNEPLTIYLKKLWNSPLKGAMRALIKRELSSLSTRKRLATQLPEVFIEHIQNKIPEISESAVKKLIKLIASGANEEEVSAFIQKRKISKKAKVKLKKELKLETKNDQEEEQTSEVENTSFYVENAGLVLLAKHLPLFFEHCQLVEEGQFVNDSSQHIAIHLLHYIATAEEQPSEEKLVLCKYLVGLKISETVEKNIKLGRELKEAARDFTYTLKEQWNSVNGTSWKTVREGFIKRSGKLVFNNPNWTMQVEKSSIDIMLDDFPWSFYEIELPWREDILNVEWNL